jgi:DNA-binding transcriptional LysR family regulator
MVSFRKPITSINLKLIQSFLMVGEYKSFKIAAELSGLTQSAMSAQIKKLEEQLGYQILERSTRSVELNKNGNQLFDSASTALQSIKDCLETLEIEGIRKKKELRIACSSVISGYQLDTLLSAISNHFPSRSLSLIELPDEEIEDAIRDSFVDIGYSSEPIRGGLNFFPLFENRLVAVVRSKMSSGKAKPVNLSDLSQHSLFIHCDNAEYERLSTYFPSEANGIARNVCRFSNAGRVIQMVEKRGGIGVLSENTADSTSMTECNIVALEGDSEIKMFGLLYNQKCDDWCSLSKAMLRLDQ